MGIIKAIGSAISGGLADQWLEVFEADDMGEQTVFTSGVLIRRGQNTKGTNNTVSNGSVIHVYDNQFMMLVDGGKVVDYTAEPGYYKVDNSSLPSMLNGELGESVKETFNRIKYGGQTPTAQKVYFLNLQEIKGIKFGTRNPINYFDNFYNAELFLRAHGNYSIKITNPLQFYAEVIPRNKDRVNYDEIGEQYLSEFLEALQSAINQMSADGTRISYVTSKAMELGKYMQDILDADWNQMRGMEIQKVGIAGISYDEESQKLINMRNEGAMLGSDFNVMRGMAVKNITEGVRDAGSNANGAMAGFMGGPANTTYGENTGVLALSKIYDPLVIRIAAVLAMILSFSPKFEAVINTIPTGIIGGISFVLYGMISAIGVRNVVENRVDFTNSRNLIVAAVILVCALGFNSVGGVGFTVGSVTINLSGLAVAAIAGILLNAILPGNDYEFDATAGSDAATSGNLQV